MRFKEYLINEKLKKPSNLSGASDEELMSYAGDFENTKWNPDNKAEVMRIAKAINKEIKKRGFRGNEIKPIFEAKGETCPVCGKKNASGKHIDKCLKKSGEYDW